MSGTLSSSRLTGLRTVLVLLVLALLARAQTFGSPVIGFDEQYYLLVGDRMLHGALPYVDVFDRKPIGLFLVYAGIRLLGGDGVIAYQLVALGFVVATAGLIAHMTRRLTGDAIAAITAGGLYVLWLNFAEGEGGQSPVFYNLPMALAGLIVWNATTDRRELLQRGAVAMLLVGLAIQIKYPALIEGVLFGCLLLLALWRTDPRPAVLAGAAVLWIGAALLPTALAMLAYWRMGALEPFVFANFLSQFGRLGDPTAAKLRGLLAMTGILGPLAAMAWRGRAWAVSGGTFIMAWLGTALLSVLVFGSYLSPHYLLPVFVPLSVAAAAAFGRHRRRLAGGLLVFFFVLGQIVVGVIYAGKGGRSEAIAMARAAQPNHGCIYVYNGFPALYLLTHSCLPTRYAFPGLLNTQSENSAAAIGVDPVAEVRRVMATRPEVVVDTDPPYAHGNPATHAVLRAALVRDYRLTWQQTMGGGERRLVYRRIEAR